MLWSPCLTGWLETQDSLQVFGFLRCWYRYVWLKYEQYSGRIDLEISNLNFQVKETYLAENKSLPSYIIDLEEGKIYSDGFTLMATFDANVDRW